MALHHMLRAAAGNAGPSDPYFEYNTLLLTGNGTNGAQNNTFLDSSTNNFTITRNGNTTQGTFSPYGDLWSNYFDGTGDTLVTPNNAAFATGTNSFTFETWVYPTASPSIWTPIASNGTGSTGNLIRLNQNINGSGKWGCLIPTNAGGDNDSLRSTNALTLNTWTHVAVVRNGSVITLYENGVQVAQQTGQTWSFTNTTGITVGYGTYAGDGYFTGYISNLRFVNGTALYTSNFTPSTTPLTAVSGTSLLTCQSNRFIDNSSNNFTLTVNGNTSVQRFSPFNPTAPYSAATLGGSGYFDGTGDYLQTPESSALGLSNVDFTIETWMYISGSRASNYPFVLGSTTAFGNGWWSLYFDRVDSVGKINFFAYSINGPYPAIVSNASPAYNQWINVAIVRNGSTLSLYLNGILDSSINVSTTAIGAASAGVIINTSSASDTFKGYLSSTRIVKGTALYTSNFTPPTAPLTAITNTSLLCNFINAGIPDAAMMNDLETVGNAQVSTSVKKYGTGSLAFDGNGDYLSAPSNTAFDLSGDFTIEFWMNVNPSIVDFARVFSRGAYNTANNLGLEISKASKTLGFRLNDTGSFASITTSVNAFDYNVWTHIAIVRSGSNVKIYSNGVGVASATNSSTANVNVPFYVGALYGLSGYEFYGYIDDLRITKGYARYTANFTPPTAALPTY